MALLRYLGRVNFLQVLITRTLISILKYNPCNSGSCEQYLEWPVYLLPVHLGRLQGFFYIQW